MSHAQLTIFKANRFHNTVPETDEKRLSKAEEINKAQEARVLEFMKTHVRKQGWTRWEIHDQYFPNMLEGSVARCLTNISYDLYNPSGTVYKTRERREGGHGATVSVWQYQPKSKI